MDLSFISLEMDSLIRIHIQLLCIPIAMVISYIV